MSRHEHDVKLNHVEYEVAYGYDKPLQEYFIQVFRKDKLDDYDFDPTGQGMMLDESSIFNKRSNGYMLNLFEIWQVPKEHKEKLAMDLPF